MNADNEIRFLRKQLKKKPCMALHFFKTSNPLNGF